MNNELSSFSVKKDAKLKALILSKSDYLITEPTFCPCYTPVQVTGYWPLSQVCPLSEYLKQV